VTISRFERADDGGFWLSFVGGDRPSCDAALAAVRSLPPWQRTWAPESRSWWMAFEGLPPLLAMLPALVAHWQQATRRRQQMQ